MNVIDLPFTNNLEDNFKLVSKFVSDFHEVVQKHQLQCGSEYYFSLLWQCANLHPSLLSPQNKQDCVQQIVRNYVEAFNHIRDYTIFELLFFFKLAYNITSFKDEAEKKLSTVGSDETELNPTPFLRFMHTDIGQRVFDIYRRCANDFNNKKQYNEDVIQSYEPKIPYSSQITKRKPIMFAVKKLSLTDCKIVSEYLNALQVHSASMPTM